jgi:hypothetical protein
MMVEVSVTYFQVMERLALDLLDIQVDLEQYLAAHQVFCPEQPL